MIPKRIAFFWSGEKMSWMRYMTLYSFCEMNPDWDIYLFELPFKGGNKPWVEFMKQDFFMYDGPDYYDKVKDLNLTVERWGTIKGLEDVSPVHQSDLFEWWWLSEIGGYYSDMDVLYLKPMPEVEEEIQVVSCICKNAFTIGVLGSDSNNRFYKEVFSKARGNCGSGKYQSAGIEAVYQLFNQLQLPGGVITRRNKKPTRGFDQWRDDIHAVFKLAYSEINILNLPEATFYPWDWKVIDKVFESAIYPLPSECVGIHWYGGAPVSQEMNNKLHEGTIKKYVNTYTMQARRLLGV